MEAKTIREFSNVIFRNSELQLLLRDYKSPQMKIEEMEKKSELIQLKRGMYIVNSTDYGIPLSVPLCSNHIYGPSYVSLHWALHYYGLIPEMVYTMTAVTTKRSRKFENQLGRFTYYQVPDDYFSIGIRMVEENGVHFLMASPEKALCDMIMYDSYLPSQSLVGVARYLQKELSALSQSKEHDDGTNKISHSDMSDNQYDIKLKIQQNAPNPFNEVTTIQCFISECIHSAQLKVYDMRGNMVKTIPITDRGNVKIQIQASSLSAGIYAYLLIGDGQTSETKQMVLTK